MQRGVRGLIDDGAIDTVARRAGLFRQSHAPTAAPQPDLQPRPPPGRCIRVNQAGSLGPATRRMIISSLPCKGPAVGVRVGRGWSPPTRTPRSLRAPGPCWAGPSESVFAGQGLEATPPTRPVRRGDGRGGRDSSGGGYWRPCMPYTGALRRVEGGRGGLGRAPDATRGAGTVDTERGTDSERRGEEGEGRRDEERGEGDSH